MDSTTSSSNVFQSAQGGRLGHLLALNGITMVNPENGERSIDSFFLEMSLSLYLAWRDFQERRGDVLPHLPELLQDCDFEWTLELRDTQFSPKFAIDQLLEATTSSTDTTLPPFAIAGSLFSFVTHIVTHLASGLGLPQISGASTSNDLNGADLFARTIPTNQADARAVMAYFHRLGVTRVASVFVNEAYGIQYNQALQKEADRWGIALVFFPIQLDTAEQSFLDLKESGVKYVFAAALKNVWKQMFRAAYGVGVLGNADYFWLTGDMNYLTVSEFGLDATSERDLAQAVHGLGQMVLEMESPSQPLFARSLSKFLANTTEQEEFLSRIREPELALLFRNFSFSDLDPQPYLYHFMVYDSVIALGLAACNTPGLFAAHELYQTLVKSTGFEGVTGPVALDPYTGTRTAVSTRYRVANLLLDPETSTNATYRIRVVPSAVIMGDNVTIENPYVYQDNTTKPPAPLPPLEGYDSNLVPRGVLVVGNCLAGAIVLLSLSLVVWTLRNRSKFIVSAAQPVFLGQLCLGCMVLASAVVPLGFQGTASTARLDMACTSIPWLLFLGYVNSMAAILSKTWRLEQIVGGAQGMRRVSVAYRDVLPPNIGLVLWNVAMLVGWTVVSPFVYVRTEVVDHQDEYGRTLESYGHCTSSNDWFYLFGGLACAANSCGFLFAAYQCYKVRDVTAYFSETRQLTYSMASLLETALLGGPILLVVKDSNPTAFFLVSSGLICICCLSFLVPIFAFKVFHSDSTYSDAREDGQRMKRHNERMHAIALDGCGADGEDKNSDASSTTSSKRGTMRIHRSSVLSNNSSGRVSLFGGASSRHNVRRPPRGDTTSATMSTSA